jgi:hypothetical protein
MVALKLRPTYVYRPPTPVRKFRTAPGVASADWMGGVHRKHWLAGAVLRSLALCTDRGLPLMCAIRIEPGLISS